MTQERRTIDSAVIDAMAKARGRERAYRTPEAQEAMEIPALDQLTLADHDRMAALIEVIQRADEAEAAAAAAEQDCLALSDPRG